MAIMTGPVLRLPEPAEVHRHIGLLQRELKLSRQLLRLSQDSKALASIADTEEQRIRVDCLKMTVEHGEDSIATDA